MGWPLCGDERVCGLVWLQMTERRAKIFQRAIFGARNRPSVFLLYCPNRLHCDEALQVSLLVSKSLYCLLVLSLAGPSYAACSATNHQQSLQKYSTWQIDGQSWDFCLYGVADNAVIWLYSLVADDGLNQVELRYPSTAEGLGMFSRTEMNYVTPESIDLNFDGHLDLRLLAFAGGTGNVGYNYWLYDPESRQFIYEPILSGRNVVADPTKLELRSGWKGGHAGNIYQYETFRWIDRALVLVSRVRQDWSSEKNCYVRQVFESKDGELVEALSECVGSVSE